MRGGVKMAEWMAVLIGIVGVIFLLGWIFKAMIKAIVFIGLAVLAFNLVFVWNGGDIAQKLHLDKWLSEETVETVVSKYEAYAIKRDEASWIDVTAIEEKANTLVDDSIAFVQKEWGEVDKEKLVNTIKAELSKVDKKEAARLWGEMKTDLAEWGITDKDVQEVIE